MEDTNYEALQLKYNEDINELLEALIETFGIITRMDNEILELKRCNGKRETADSMKHIIEINNKYARTIRKRQTKDK